MLRAPVAGALFALALAMSGGSAQAQDLTVTFADPAWDGERIPDGQHCKKFGGDGATPPLRVSNIPAEANALVVEFNDKSYQPLSRNGGHGIIGFVIEPGVGETVLPAVPGGAAEMPEGVWLEKKNRAKGAWRSPGYLPPCSGGRNNRYEAEVYAVVRAADGAYEEIAEGEISLGRY
ncbi:MAG: hypothetical protein NXI21_09835 [Alphaproteobacteria bacterium]|nr:hypothetical protein [Alphaproteobacteria bacterium]